jgi:hypothetical protein
VPTPIRSNNESSGIFSVAFLDSRIGIVVGGDYRKEKEAADNIALTTDGGSTWDLVTSNGLSGFRSAVTYVGKNTVIAVGPSGTDVSTDGGKSWKQTDTLGFHALSSLKNGKALWGVGEKGRVAKFKGLSRNRN